MSSESINKSKLWNKNFFLLWQGQLVSMLGDAIYIMALNFWVLDMTGSTAMMGLLSALTMLPRVLVGPFAGVFVDRLDRKKIIVFTDFIRGIFVTFIGIAAIGGFIQVWMVFVVGIIDGLCAAFFDPAASSVKPDIVPEDKLMNANSVTSLAQSGMNMLGSAVGGILYIAIGAPYMFLFNGISYIFSGITELFISVPKVKRKNIEITFFEDFKDGLMFLKDFRILRNSLICASLMNFFANSAFILMVPYFKEMPFLGIEKYGFAMTMFSLGTLVGSVILSITTIKKEYKFKLFIISSIGNLTLFLGFMITNNYYLMLLFIFLALVCNVFLNTMISTSMMSVLPGEMRGKILAINSTISLGLIPIGQCLGGVLGEFLPIRIVMISLLSCGFISGIFFIKVRHLNKFIEYDSSVDSLEKLIKN